MLLQLNPYTETQYGIMTSCLSHAFGYLWVLLFEFYFVYYFSDWNWVNVHMHTDSKLYNSEPSHSGISSYLHGLQFSQKSPNLNLAYL